MADRTKPSYWDENRRQWWRHARVPLTQYAKYSRWFRGEVPDLSGNYATTGGDSGKKWSGGLDNMANLVTRSARADLFFRSPRFVVKAPGSLNVNLFTPQLASIETSLLNAVMEQAGLYRQGRRALTDALLGPFGVLKVGFSGDVSPDTELIDNEREAANLENQDFLSGSNPRTHEDDLHSVHIEQHEQLVAAAERGDLKVAKSRLKYMKKHIEKHQEMVPFERPKETLRNDSVFVRRRSPLNVFFDPWAEDPTEREWVGERYIARIEDVQANKDFNAVARKNLQSLDTRWFQEENLPQVPFQTLDTPDQYCLLYEIIDFVTGKVVRYAQGGSTPLEVLDWSLFPLLPSGPYVDFSFMEDPFEGFGVPPPVPWEAHQRAATYLCAVNTKTVQRGSPKTGYNAQYLKKEEIDNLKKFEASGIFPFQNVPPGARIADLLFQIPPCEVPAQNIQQEAYHRSMVEKFSGLGAAKLGGGDTAKTATASAIISDSVNNLSEDNAAVVDDWMSRVGRLALRLTRRFYTRTRVAELAGEDALKHWPWEWAERDIRNDRGVIVVPGSSRRRNTSVDQKLLMDAIGMVTANPQVPVTVQIELMRRFFEEAGISALDWDGVQEQALLQKLLQMAQESPESMPGLGGAPGASEGPGRSSGAPRPSEAEEPSKAGQAQGIANVGGGRVGTGASQGDKPKFMRGGMKGG